MTERHPLSQKFHDLLKVMGEIHDTKQSDYGRAKDPFANLRASEEFGIDPWVATMVRGNDKMARIKTMATKSSLENESLRDSLLDLANYAVIALVLYEEQYKA